MPRIGMMTCLRVAVGGLVVAIAPTLYAQTAYSANSLTELFHLAEINSPSIASAKASLQATHEKARQSFAAFLPLVSYNGSKSEQNSQSTTNDKTAPENNSTAYKHELALTQPLYNRASSVQYQISKQQIQKQEFDLSQLVLDLRSKVAQAYFLILTYEDTLRLLSAQNDTFSQQLAQAKRSYELGISTITDIHEAQSKLDSLIAQEIGTTKELEAAKVSLRTLIGKNFKLEKIFQIPFNVQLKIIPNMSDLLEQAYAYNYQIRSLNTVAELALLDIKKANAQHYPSLDFSASTSSSRQYAITAATAYTQLHNTQVGVYLSIPLYSGGAISSKAREALHNYDKVLFDIQNAKLSLEEEIQANYVRWKLGMTQIDALEKAIVSSESALKSVNTGYSLGVRIGLDVFSAQQQVIQLKKDLLKAKYDTLMSILKIKTATGQSHVDLF